MTLNLDIPLDFTSCSLPALVQHANSSITDRPLVISEIRSRLPRMLSGFVDNPVDFLEVLQSAHGVLSGSFAVAYFQGLSSWLPGDLDIYVPLKGYSLMLRHLTNLEGFSKNFVVEEARQQRLRAAREARYTRQLCALSEHDPSLYSFDTITENSPPFDSTTAHDTPAPSIRPIPSGLHGVTSLFKDGRKVDIIISKSANALYPLAHFWSTLQMNYITAQGCCCAYPAYTFNRTGIINNGVLDEGLVPDRRILPLLAKYEERGFTFRAAGDVPYERASQAEPHNNHFAPPTLLPINSPTANPSLRRYFGDGHCFTLHFEDAVKQIRTGGPLPVSSAIEVSWNLGGIIAHRRVNRRIRAAHIRAS